MTYEGQHRPLTAYTAAMAAAGLVIEVIREPLKLDGGNATMPFLHLLARQPSTAGRPAAHHRHRIGISVPAYGFEWAAEGPHTRQV